MLVFSEHLDALAAKPPSTHPPGCAAGLKFPPRSDLIPGELYTTCTWGPRNRASFHLFRISRAGRPVSTSLLKLPHLIYSLTVTALIKENIALLDNNVSNAWYKGRACGTCVLLAAFYFVYFTPSS